MTRKKTARKMAALNPGVEELVQERRDLPPTCKPGSFHGQMIFRYRISYLEVLLSLPIHPGEILNKIALLYSSSTCSKVKTWHEKFFFIQCLFKETAKEFLKRGHRQ